MIRDLTNIELEQASAGFSCEGSISLTDGDKAQHVSNIVLAVALDDTPLSLLQAEQALRPALGQSKKEASALFRKERRDKHLIHQGDGVHESWESYRPQQPSFRSRFINR